MTETNGDHRNGEAPRKKRKRGRRGGRNTKRARQRRQEAAQQALEGTPGTVDANGANALDGQPGHSGNSSQNSPHAAGHPKAGGGADQGANQGGWGTPFSATLAAMNEPSDLTLLRQLLESGEWECPAEGKKLIPSVLLAAVLNKEINPDGTTRPGEWSQTSRIRAARLYVDLVKHRGEVAAKAVGKSVNQDEDVFDATPDQSRLAAILARLGTDPSLAFLGRTGTDSAGAGAE